MAKKFEESADARFSFFPRGRRIIRLDKIVQQVGGSNKKAQRITVFHATVPLVAPFEGFPDFIQAGLEAVEKDDSFVSKCPLGDFKLAGITIEFYSTEKSKDKERLELLTNLTLYDFVVEKEKDIPVLRMKFKCQESLRILKLWLKHGLNDGLWAAFTPTDGAIKQGDGIQMSLTGDNGPKDEEESEEEEATTGPAIVKTNGRAAATV